jgi:hypothetical protein
MAVSTGAIDCRVKQSAWFPASRASLIDRPRTGRGFQRLGEATNQQGSTMKSENAQAPEHEHQWVRSESLQNAAGVPYDVEQVRCAECGEVREQEKKRIVA